MLRRERVAAAVVAAAWLAMAARFFQACWLRTPRGKTWIIADDMYISASFARTLVQGEGLRWYPGAPKVEGFSNPLWVLALSVMHVLPGFREDQLGAYVFALNATLLAILALVTFAGLARLARPDQEPAARWRWAAVSLLAIGAASLCYWSACGFEVLLASCVTTLAFVEALRPAEQVRTAWIGCLIGLAFWTRMDALLCCVGSVVVVLLKVREPKRIFQLGLTAGLMILALLLARRAYFGDWLPNTYYLKLYRWPIAERLPHGLHQNRLTLRLGLLLIALTAYGCWRLDRRWRPALLALTAPLFMLGYSTLSGGDFVFRRYGYDRYGAMSAGLLVLGLAAIVLGARTRRWESPLVALSAMLIALGPVFLDYGFDWVLLRDRYQFAPDLLEDLRHPRRDPQRNSIVAFLIHKAKVLRDITTPSARIAVCDAGGIVYFSHRGGVDILGKVDPYVARLRALDHAPDETRCWRGVAPPGHNKEDVPGLFRLRQPELSIVEPPAAERAKYVKISYEKHEFYALRATPVVRWERVTTLP
jgi:hypothetical protein